jgi:hypothetical protein
MIRGEQSGGEGAGPTHWVRGWDRNPPCIEVSDEGVRVQAPPHTEVSNEGLRGWGSALAPHTERGERWGVEGAGFTH